MRTKIAWFTPFPPEKSAIAEYSVTILKELCSQEVVVELWIDGEDEKLVSYQDILIRNYGRNPSELDNLINYDLIVYNMGNHFENHRGIFETSLKFPGIVILHDYVLHHFFAAYYLSYLANPHQYIYSMKQVHGDDGKEVAEAVLSRLSGPPIWETDEVFYYPLNKQALSNSLAVITHSMFVKNLLSDYYKGRLEHLDFPSKSMELVQKSTKSDLGIPDDKIVMLTLGDVNPNKRYDQVLRTIAQNEYLKEKIFYVVIGKFNVNHYDIISKVDELGLKDSVRFLGRQPNDVVEAYLSVTDIGVNLRYPTMGESSWTVLQMMQLGIPCIVTKIGWYDEIPDDCIFKIPLENEIERLTECLVKMIQDKDARVSKGFHGKTFSKEVFSTKRYCDRFLQICDSVRRDKIIYNLVDRISADIHLMGINSDNNTLLDTVSNEIANLQDTINTQGLHLASNRTQLGTSKSKNANLPSRNSEYMKLVLGSVDTMTGLEGLVPKEKLASKQDISSLLQYDGYEFVVKLYSEILGREPEPNGLTHHLDMLNGGYSKEALIYSVACSDEARHLSVRFAGIEKLKGKYYVSRIKRAFRKIPVFIWVYRWVMLPVRVHDLGRTFNLYNSVFDSKLKTITQEIQQRMEQSINKVSMNNMELKNDSQELKCEIRHVEKLINELKISIHEQNIANEEWERSIAELKSCLKNDWVNREQKGLAFYCGNDVVVTKVDEFIIGIPAKEWRLAGYMAFKGQLEPGSTRLFRSFVRPGMVVVDVGANIGIYTLIAASLVGHTGKVYSFEPTPNTFKFLKDNIQVNGFLETGIVSLYQEAVSDTFDRKKLAVYDNNSGHNTLFPSGTDDTVIEVLTIKLDDHLPKETRIDVVKIDAEGSEPFVLRGMSRIIEENPEIIVFMEFAPSHLKRAGIHPGDFINEIRQLGFQIKKIDDLTGELADIPDSELESCFSTNIILRNIY